MEDGVPLRKLACSVKPLPRAIFCILRYGMVELCVCNVELLVKKSLKETSRGMVMLNTASPVLCH